MLRFLGEILIPLRDFDDQVARSVGDALATQARFYREPGRVVELIEFRIRRLVSRLKSFVHDDVARRARAHAAAGVIEALMKSRGDIEDASRETFARVGNFLRIYFDRFAFADKCHLEFFCRGRVLGLFNVGVAAAHGVLLLNCSMLCANLNLRCLCSARLQAGTAETPEHARLKAGATLRLTFYLPEPRPAHGSSCVRRAGWTPD